MAKNPSNNGGKWIRPDKRLAIYLRDGFCCVYCGRDLVNHPGELTLDHVSPCNHNEKPDNRARNLVTCCKRCNSSKQDLKVSDFIRVLIGWGVDCSEVIPRIRRNTRRSLKKYRKEAKQILANR